MACKEQISMVLDKLEQCSQAMISFVIMNTKNKEERKKNIASNDFGSYMCLPNAHEAFDQWSFRINSYYQLWN